MDDKKIFYTTGAKKDRLDKRDFRASGVIPTLEIPKQIFNLDELFGPKNQYSRGSCTSQAQGHHKERQEKRKSSARMIMAKTKELEGNKDYGAYTRDTFAVVKEFGICSEELYPEPGPEISWEEYIDVSKIPDQCYEDAKGHKSQSYWRVEKDLTEIKSLLFQRKEKNSSIVCSMEWYKEFNRPVDGRLPISFSGDGDGHAVELKGWNDFEEHLTFKNSWGVDWGDGGYFYMPYSIFNKVIWDLWCSLDIPAEMPVDLYYNEKRTWSSFLLEKSFAFNLWLIKKIGRLPSNREIKGLCYGMWDYETIFLGIHGDMWLKITKPEAVKRGLIKN